MLLRVFIWRWWVTKCRKCILLLWKFPRFKAHFKHLPSMSMLGCVIFFPRLTYVVYRGVRGGAERPLCCAECAAGGSQGGRQPSLSGSGAAPREIFFLDPILGWANLPMVLCMIFAHGIGRDGFSVHGIGCFGMYKYVL